MKRRSKNRLKTLWSQTASTPSVERYFDCFAGEFDTAWLESDYPYEGRASATFRRVVKMDDYEASERFEGRGEGCWAPRRNHFPNSLTADLFAAADLLGGKQESKFSSAMPFGLGADSGAVWVSLLDGGVGVEVVMWEHEYTNRMHGRQRTTVRGPTAYRALLELLGFDWIDRRLVGEKIRPSHQEIRSLVELSC